MTLNQLLPLVDTLAHDDKFQLMQILLNKIAAEENIKLTEASTPLPAANSPPASIRDNAGFGMWADRTDTAQQQLQDIRQLPSCQRSARHEPFRALREEAQSAPCPCRVERWHEKI